MDFHFNYRNIKFCTYGNIICINNACLNLCVTSLDPSAVNHTKLLSQLTECSSTFGMPTHMSLMSKCSGRLGGVLGARTVVESLSSRPCRIPKNRISQKHKVQI